MRHSYIDKYAGLDSFLHRIDPRIKIITFFTFVIFIALTRPEAYLSFVLYGVILLAVLFISRIPFLFVFRKSLLVIPFVVLIALFMPFIKKGEVFWGYSFGRFRWELSREGVLLFWNVVIKSYLSIVSMILLTSSTKFTNFLKGLERLKIPRIFIMIISFMYRYSFLLVDEAQRMQKARESRTFGSQNTMRTIRTLSNIVGVLFVRSYERAERVYLAMCSRGFEGEVRTLDKFNIRISDILFLVSIFTVLFLIQLI